MSATADARPASIRGSCDDLAIYFAVFPTAMPTGPAIGDMSIVGWDRIVASLRCRREGPKDGPNFVPARFKPEPDGRVRRLKTNVLARSAVVLDIEGDKKTGEKPPSVTEAAQRIEAEGWAAVLYTSHSHTAAAPRYRVVFPVSAEVDAMLPAPEAIADQMEITGVLDRSKIGASSLFYLPSAAPGRLADHETVVVAGDPIDATWLTERANAILAAREAAQARQRAEALAASERRRAARIAEGLAPTDELIQRIRDHLDMERELLRHGYDKRGDVFLFPKSETGIPGVHILRGSDGVERVFSHHSGDPLAAANLPSWCTTKAIDVVDVAIILDHGGDRKRGLHALATQFRIETPRPERKPEAHTNGADAPPTPPPKSDDPARPQHGDLPLIRIIAGELHNTATAGEAAILAGGLTIYQRGKALVRPVVQDVPAAKGRMTVSAALHDIDGHGLVDALCGCARWEKFDGRDKQWRRIDPPRAVADTILSRAGLWTLPKIAGVITTPTLRPDGSILSAPGYDAATRLYHAADPAVTLAEAAQAPTRAIALRALELLESLLTEFPFVNNASRAVALSGLITPVVRGALAVAPLHAFRASTAGSGKSYLVDIASAIASGKLCPVASAGSDIKETESRLTGLLLAGFPIASLDNVNGELGGDLLCQAVERPLIRLRPLGRSDIVEVENHVTLFATGNGLCVRGDMVRRTLVADLDAGMERPELRAFVGDPVASVMTARGRYVSACLAIVRAYILAGRPDVLRPIASFSDWSDNVRSALVWLGCADPADSMESARQDDPELAELRQVTTAWWAAIEKLPVTCRKAIEIAGEKVARADEHGDVLPYAPATELRHPALQDALLQVAGVRSMVDSTRLGKWLQSRSGRIVAGMRFVRDGTTAGASRWKLENLAG